MPNRLYRLWMLWLVIALQAMTPFIHAHAGAVQLEHAGWMHGHSPLGSAASCLVAAPDGHEVGLEVAQGLPLRHAALAGAADARGAATPRMQAAAMVGTASLGFLGSPMWSLPPPDHALPQALAPPFC